MSRPEGKQSRVTPRGLVEVVLAISATTTAVAAPLVGGVEARNLAIVSALQFLTLALSWRRRRLDRGGGGT